MNSVKSIRRTAGILLAAILCLCGLNRNVSAEDVPQDSIVIDGHIHTPQEVMKLIERSPLKYVIDPFVDSLWEEARKTVERPVVPSAIHLVKDSGGAELVAYELTDSLQVVFDSAEAAFGRKDYARAKTLYLRALQGDSPSSSLFTYLGDCFFFGDSLYDSAAYYYGKATEVNFIDYQAHWFLGDAYRKMGRNEGAVREVTLAHILNRNHADILKRLKSLRGINGRPWVEWEFEPKYAVMRDKTDSMTIHVNCDPKWLGYALVKALWKFEPAYAQKMRRGDTLQEPFSEVEEKEALVCVLAQLRLDSMSVMRESLEKIVANGDVEQFMVYEFVSKDYPTAVLYLRKEQIESMVKYVDKYH